MKKFMLILSVALCLLIAGQTSALTYPNSNDANNPATGHLGWILVGSSEEAGFRYMTTARVTEQGGSRIRTAVRLNYISNYPGWAGLQTTWNPVGQENISWIKFDLASAYPWGMYIYFAFGDDASRVWKYYTLTCWPQGTQTFSITDIASACGIDVATARTISGVLLQLDINMVGEVYGGRPATPNFPVWLEVWDVRHDGTGCGSIQKPFREGDINKDCIVNLADFADVAANWLKAGVSPMVFNVRNYGAVGDGVADDSSAIFAAVQAAAASGYTPKRVYFPSGTYRLGSEVNIGNANTELYGDGDASIIKTDGMAFMLWQPNIYIHDLRFVNITAPYLVDRIGEGKGYQPTVNDLDIWDSLTPSQQNQHIGPEINSMGQYLVEGQPFRVENVHIQRVTGEFLSITLYDTKNSVIEDCNIRGGKGFGAITLWNSCNDPNASSNCIIRNNIITYGSFNGICISGGRQVTITNNIVRKSGESGIKTYSNDDEGGSGVNRRCRQMTITYNESSQNYYDGFDLCTNVPHTGTFDTEGTIVTNNNAHNNFRTGYYSDGKTYTYQNNTAQDNGLGGFGLRINNSSFESNTAINNNLNNDTGSTGTAIDEFTLEGTGLTITGNTAQRSYIHNGWGLYTASSNTRSGNTLTNCFEHLY